jgi:heat shock transcription factor
MQNQPFPPPQQATNEQYMRWNQGAADNAVFPDMNFGMAQYGANGVSNAPFQQAVPAQSTQLARRPVNQQLVPTASRTQFDNPNEWGLGDELFDPNAQMGGHAENDSIERLEERAQVAKREAQAKRKQIPPFVQKLNR